LLFIIKFKVTPSRSKKILMYAKNFDECMEIVSKTYPDTWETIEYNSQINERVSSPKIKGE